MLYNLRFFCSKCSLFHNCNVFGSCIINILYTGCAKIKKNNNSGAKSLNQVRTKVKIPFPLPLDIEHDATAVLIFSSRWEWNAGCIFRPLLPPDKQCTVPNTQRVRARGKQKYMLMF